MGALISLAQSLSPDAIVSDITMPGVDGIAAAAAILLRNPAARIVFVTVHRDPMLVECGLATGALGYVLKGSAGEDLIPAVHSGFGPSVTSARRCCLRIERAGRCHV
jgi:DNA-binding NarL/FixJ family response regulator